MEVEIISLSTEPTPPPAAPTQLQAVDVAHCLQFKSHIKDLNDPKRPLIAARCPNNCLTEDGGIAMSQLVQNVGGWNHAIKYPMKARAGGVNDWPDRTKAIGAFPNWDMSQMGSMLKIIEADLHPVIDGDYFHIPNVFVLSAELSGYLNGPSFMSNYAGREHLYSSVADPDKPVGIYVYGYKNGDESQPWMLLFSAVAARPNEAAMWWFDLTPVKPIGYQNPEDTFALFNLTLAEAMRKDPKFVTKQLLLQEKSGITSDVVIPSFEQWSTGSGSFTALKFEPDAMETSVNVGVDYMSVASLVNDTDAPLVMKTPDYALKLTETTQYSWSNNEKVNIGTSWSYKASVKNSMKVKVEDFYEDTTETAAEWSVGINLGFEYTHLSTNTNTSSTEQTYTVGGQTITVPPKTVMSLTAGFKRCTLRGSMKVYYPLLLKPTMKVIHKWFNRADPVVMNSSMDVDAVMSVLKLPAFEKVKVKNADGKEEEIHCVWHDVPFTATNSAVSSISVKTIGPTK